MTFPNSGLFVPTFVDILDTTQLAVDLDLETHKVALFLNAIASPDLTVDTAYGVAPWNANESSGTGYTAGGAVLTSTTFLHTSGGVVAFAAGNTSWATSSITSRGAQIYADALAGNNGIVAVNFGADYTSTAGTFLITWASAIFSIDLIP